MQLIHTKYGDLRGKRKDTCYTYFGIPYAQPPVGDLRWKAPQPLQPWDGVLEAYEFPHRAWQMVQEPPVDGKGINYAREFYSNPAFMPPMDEDCLYLNIWRPLTGEKLPVAFWIHGGALINGFGSELEFDGEAFARKGVILVTINYRLGAFGFLCHPELAKEDPNGRCGNYGIFDQIAALKWVKENIESFGGDPDRITIFGQSAGAMSVQTLLSSPLSRDMMAGAIMQSAGGYQAGILQDRTMQQGMELGLHFSKLTGAETLEELRALPPQRVMDVVGGMMAEGFRTGYGLPFTAVIDGYLLEKGYDAVVEAGECPDIPYMIGSCGNDLGQTPEMTSRGGHTQLYYGCINWSLKTLSWGVRLLMFIILTASCWEIIPARSILRNCGMSLTPCPAAGAPNPRQTTVWLSRSTAIGSTLSRMATPTGKICPTGNRAAGTAIMSSCWTSTTPDGMTEV